MSTRWQVHTSATDSHSFDADHYEITDGILFFWNGKRRGGKIVKVFAPGAWTVISKQQ